MRAMKCRCAECGFFCVQDIGDGTFTEADSLLRKNGRIGIRLFPVGASGVEQTVIQNVSNAKQATCFERAENFDGLNGEALLVKTANERECQRFFAWKQGFSPKEHREMQLSEQISRREELREAQMMRWQERRDRVMIFSTIFAAVANGIIAGAFVLAVYFMSNSRPEQKSPTATVQEFPNSSMPQPTAKQSEKVKSDDINSPDWDIDKATPLTRRK
jgi:hypothetical protein